MKTQHSISSGFLREKHILKLLPVAHSTLWEWVRGGNFPPPKKLSENVSVWSEAEIDAWLEAKFADQGVTDDSTARPLDNIGHNGGPPLDEAIEQDDPSVTPAENKERGEENGL